MPYCQDAQFSSKEDLISYCTFVSGKAPLILRHCFSNNIMIRRISDEIFISLKSYMEKSERKNIFLVSTNVSSRNGMKKIISAISQKHFSSKIFFFDFSVRSKNLLRDYPRILEARNSISKAVSENMYNVFLLPAPLFFLLDRNKISLHRFEVFSDSKIFSSSCSLIVDLPTNYSIMKKYFSNLEFSCSYRKETLLTFSIYGNPDVFRVKPKNTPVSIVSKKEPPENFPFSGIRFLSEISRNFSASLFLDFHSYSSHNCKTYFLLLDLSSNKKLCSECRITLPEFFPVTVTIFPKSIFEFPLFYSDKLESFSVMEFSRKTEDLDSYIFYLSKSFFRKHPENLENYDFVDITSNKHPFVLSACSKSCFFTVKKSP